MPKRSQKHPEKPWHPDPVKWAKLLKKEESAKCLAPIQPDKGWQLWNWNTLEDAKQ